MMPTNSLQAPMKTYKKLALTAAVTTAFVQSASAVVYLEFLQIGNDVHMSFSGSLNLGYDEEEVNTLLNAIEGSQSNSNAATSYMYTGVAAVSITGVGASAPPQFDFSDLLDESIVERGGGSFGYGGAGGLNAPHVDTLFWDLASRSTDFRPPAMYQLVVTPDSYYTVFGNSTLDSQRVLGMALNSVLWTANITGDTIQLRTPTAAVPEPSSTTLLGLSALGLLLRRRRQQKK